MNSFNIAFKLFKSNIKTYGYYLAVMIFAVSVYYDFMALKYNPEVLKSEEMIIYAKMAAQLASVILILVLVFFMWYSSSFFLKQRKKEIGIYLLSGISNAKIGLVFAVESLFLGITAVTAGLLLGIVTSKLFIMVLAKVALLKVAIAFSVPAGAVLEVTVTFGVVFLALSFGSFVSVARSRLIDLIGDAKKKEGIPRLKIIRGIFAVILIGAGYYLSARMFESSNPFAMSLVVLIIVVLGTYWLFGAFMSLVMRVLIGSKSFMYRGVRIVSISNIAFRLKANYRSLAMLAIMAAVTITAFGVSLSLRYYVDNTHKIQFPYSFSYISGDEALGRKVADTINNSEHELLLQERIPFLKINSVKINETNFSGFNVLAVKYSDFIRVSGDLKVKGLEKLAERVELSEKSVTYIDSPGTIGSTIVYKGRDLLVDGSEYYISESLKTPLFGDGDLVGHIPCIIVSDAVYEKLAAGHNEQFFNGFLVSDPENSLMLAQELMGLIPEDNSFFAYVGVYLYKFAFIGLFFFLGTFMSIVFILATGSIMYFKLLSEGLADRGKYEILSRIGMSGEEIRKAVSMQVGISLILPFLIGIVHSIFAIKVLQDLMSYDLTVPTLAAIVIFAVAYAIFYALTTRKFLRLVSA